ncbi:biliverdin-producing heme oxygenase [Sphingobium bisphenolivorans]|uniref:biliverdin-producing heme oxygenase n=1 Tax=Sphingobium bisphenolivorans TaxID=1335760 RepID=UPI0003A6A729|nr:biliverdin-producing heme oxygenase [Sphingobium bisphenolivorans]
MTNPTHAGRARQALRQATTASHQRVDDLFTHFTLSDVRSYASFLRAHARALVPLEAVARPDASRLALLAEDLAALGEVLPPSLDINGAEGEGFRWGALYALEGSRLGGAVLARRVGSDLPHAYLSAVHDKGGWIAFQERLDAAADDGDADWMNQAVRGAEAAFGLFEAAARAEMAAGNG